MRAEAASRIEPVSEGVFEYLVMGWRQAGFGSFAYRLAHLTAPRPAIVLALSLIFVFG